MTHFVDHIVGLHGLTVYAVVGALVLAETALFVGFVVPGETAAIIGGVVASRGNASLSAMCVLVVVMAIIGDTIGYAIGARWGDQVLHTRIFRKRTAELERAEAVLRRRGGPAVFLGRFIAFLRASWAELQRVQWPDRRQVGQATAVVIGFVVVAGLYLGVADWAAKKIVDFII